MFGDEDFDEDILRELEDSKTIENKSTENIIPGPSISSASFYSHKDITTTNIEKSVSTKRVLKRKFPGPAGLFPESNRVLNRENTVETPLLTSSQFLCTQSSNLSFDGATWQDMCKDFKESNLINEYNIEWINNNVELSLVNKKVPFLSAIVKQIKNTSKSPILVLADRTGEIEAVMSTELYEDYNSYLTIGSVLVLKLFSLLSITASKHYINITSNNLVRIYSSKDLSNDYVKIIHLQEHSVATLENDIKGFLNRNGEFRNDLEPKRLWNSAENMNRLTNEGLSTRDKSESGSTANKNHLDTHSRQDNRFKTDQNNRDPPSHLLNNNNSNITKKFSFKNSLCQSTKVNLSNLAHICQTTPPTSSTSIFDHDLTDLDFELDAFKDEFTLHEVRQSTKTPSNNLQNDKKEIDLVQYKSSVQSNGDPTKGSKIDCSQIEIISPNKENPDIIKQVFSDFDASAFFDDF